MRGAPPSCTDPSASADLGVSLGGAADVDAFRWEGRGGARCCYVHAGLACSDRSQGACMMIPACTGDTVCYVNSRFTNPLLGALTPSTALLPCSSSKVDDVLSALSQQPGRTKDWNVCPADTDVSGRCC
jgi:hypothetical protein